jgi:hypothetical protein
MGSDITMLVCLIINGNTAYKPETARPHQAEVPGISQRQPQYKIATFKKVANKEMIFNTSKFSGKKIKSGESNKGKPKGKSGITERSNPGIDP